MMEKEHLPSVNKNTLSSEEGFAAYLCDALPSPVQERANNLLNWYMRHSRRNKKLYLCISILTVIFPAAATTVSIFNPFTTSNLIIALLSMSTTILASVNSLFRFRENWTRYRSSTESIKREISLYLAKSQLGKEKSELLELSQVLETIAKNESMEWCETHHKSPNV
jgi:hypothetical protein